MTTRAKDPLISYIDITEDIGPTSIFLTTIITNRPSVLYSKHQTIVTQSGFCSFVFALQKGPLPRSNGRSFTMPNTISFHEWMRLTIFWLTALGGVWYATFMGATGWKHSKEWYEDTLAAPVRNFFCLAAYQEWQPGFQLTNANHCTVYGRSRYERTH